MGQSLLKLKQWLLEELEGKFGNTVNWSHVTGYNAVQLDLVSHWYQSHRVTNIHISKFYYPF